MNRTATAARRCLAASTFACWSAARAPTTAAASCASVELCVSTAVAGAGATALAGSGALAGATAAAFVSGFLMGCFGVAGFLFGVPCRCRCCQAADACLAVWLDHVPVWGGSAAER